ncbi:ZN160 protein, partial [Podargus strigoides]|nr:ZN160 protein [Podargus strigoides]
SFSQREYLQRHHKLMHAEKLPYRCSSCSLSFSQPDQLRRHYQIVHDVERPYHCNVCNR